jgi:peptide deformylase
LINPILAIVDPTPCLFFEGCLSLNGFTAVTPRAAAVRVTAFNEKGEAIEINAGGWYARILQHEIDHLNGCLYIDRMLPATFMTSVNFQRHWSGQPIPSVCSALGVHGT